MRDERVARLLDDPEKLPGVAATARRAQGRKAAAEQGPALEHANLVRAGRAGDEIAIASSIGRRGVPDTTRPRYVGCGEKTPQGVQVGDCALHTVIGRNSRRRKGLEPSRRLSETAGPRPSGAFRIAFLTAEVTNHRAACKPAVPVSTHRATGASALPPRTRRGTHVTANCRGKLHTLPQSRESRCNARCSRRQRVR